VLRRTFGPKREDVTGWRKWHNEKLYNFKLSSNIMRAIKSRTVRWAGHVAYFEDVRNAYRSLVGKPEGKRSLRELGIDRWTRLKWIVRLCTGFSLFRTGTSGWLL